MAKVTVTPEEFTMVRFDSARIRDLASVVADAVGLADDLELRIEVDEQSPLGRTRVTSFDPVTITTESGAFEDPRRIRDLSDAKADATPKARLAAAVALARATATRLRIRTLLWKERLPISRRQRQPRRGQSF